MSTNYCRCCLNKDGILLAIKTQSSHKDGKTLLDYFNLVLGLHIKEHNASDFICMRCSKALQVAYHFISMVKESKEYTDYSQCGNELNIVDSLSIKNIQYKFQETQSPLLSNKSERTENEIDSKRQLDQQTNNSDVSWNELDTIKSPSSFKIMKHGTQTDAGPFELNKRANTDINCIICNKFFADKHSFFEHNRQQHKEIMPYKCKLCSFYTCYTESIRKHYEKMHGLKNVALDFYQTKNMCKTSEKSPNFEITYFCLHCNFKACNQLSIDDHLSKVHLFDEDKDSFVKEIFGCPSCHRSFMNLKSAKIHYSMYHVCSIKRNNTCNTKKFNCGKCGKLFDLKSGLFLHGRICEKRKAVKCNFCSVKFTSVLNYERHLQDKHSVAITHECEICSKKFSCSEYLTVHRKRHNERNYQCDLCPKNYIGNSALKIHKQRKHAMK